MDLAAGTVVVRTGTVLLVKRSDVEAWTLPGGGVEPGESVADTAVRETREETGLDVELIRLVGIYYVPHWKYGSNHEVLFLARPKGGQLRPQESEVVELGFFDPDALPEPLLWWQRQRIRDAIGGAGGSMVRQQNVTWPFEGQALPEVLDDSDRSKQDFFQRYFAKPQPVPPDLEVSLIADEPH